MEEKLLLSTSFNRQKRPCEACKKLKKGWKFCRVTSNHSDETYAGFNTGTDSAADSAKKLGLNTGTDSAADSAKKLGFNTGTDSAADSAKKLGFNTGRSEEHTSELQSR